MDANASPLQDGEPTPHVDPEVAWQQILAALEDRYPGISSWDAGERDRRVITDAMAGRPGHPAPEPEAGP